MKTNGFIIAVLFTVASVSLAASNDIATTLQKGLFEEEANHNLGAAIQLYQSVVAQFDKDRKLAATAVFRLGECFRKQGKTNEATAQYERVLREFADQAQLVNLSRQNLLALGGSLPPTTAPGLPVGAREEQKRLLQQEIKLVEQQLATQQKRVQEGVISTESLITTERELLKLKRQFAALEAGEPLRDLAASESSPVTATEAEEVRRIQGMIKDSPDLINAPDESGNRFTPLIKASRNGQLVVARFLVSSGANVESKDSYGRTALYWAASQGHKGVVELLLTSKAQPNNPDNSGRTPLHAAAEKGFRTVAEVLLANGANVNAVAEGKWTPLHLAVANGFRSVAELLLEKGADVNASASTVRTQAESFSGTPLHIAATRGDLAIAEMLLDHKADPELASPTGMIPLYAAAMGNHVQVAAALLSHGARVDTKASNPEYLGWTPLHFAVAQGSKEMVDFLLKNKADPNARIEASSDRNRGPAGSTPLLLATAKCNTDIVQSLLSAKGDPNLKSDAGETPIINAMTRCNPPERTKILALLLDQGAATEPTDGQGNTPLLLAAAKQDKQALELLLKHGANPNAKINGYTALHFLASALGSGGPFQDLLPMARDLVDAKADVNAQSPDVRTPLKIASDLSSRSGVTHAAEARKQFADILRKAGAVEDLPQLDRIEVARPSGNFGAPVFWKGTNDYNRFSLFELVAVEYQLCAAPPGRNPSAMNYAPMPPPGLAGTPRAVRLGTPQTQYGPLALAFPDFSKVVIRRATPNGKSREALKVDLANAFNSETCSGEQPLKWGDVVEIPEADHPISALWQGLSENVRTLLVQCLTRTVEVRIKGQTTNMVLKPSMTGQVPVDFTLLSTLNDSKLLRASSDLCRVKVTRHDAASGQSYELQLDCSPSGTGYDLWLRDGDMVEVPEKP